MATLASVAFTVNFTDDDRPHDFLRTLAELFSTAKTIAGARAPEPVGYHATNPLIKAPPAASVPSVPPVEAEPEPAAAEAPKKARKSRGTGVQAPVVPATPAGPLVDDPIPDFTSDGPDEAPAPAAPEPITVSVDRIRILGNGLMQALKDGNVGHSYVTRTMKSFGAAKYPELTVEQRSQAYHEWLGLFPADQVAAIKKKMAEVA